MGPETLTSETLSRKRFKFHGAGSCCGNIGPQFLSLSSVVDFCQWYLVVHGLQAMMKIFCVVASSSSFVASPLRCAVCFTWQRVLEGELHIQLPGLSGPEVSGSL